MANQNILDQIDETFKLFFLNKPLLLNNEVIELSTKIQLIDSEANALPHEYQIKYLVIKSEECFAYSELNNLTDLKNSLNYTLNLYSKFGVSYENSNFEKIIFHQMRCLFIDKKFDESKSLIQSLKKQYPENIIYRNWENVILKKTTSSLFKKVFKFIS